MIEKVLVANRGEIAIRAFRAAYELGLRTVAVYTHADRAALHRQKADEAYQIGGPDHPLRPYLDPEVIVDLARRVGADAIYPGYGFMSEDPLFASACRDAGLTWVGPPPEILRLTGDKLEARNAARNAGIPVLAATDLLDSPDAAVEKAEALGYPVFVKAAAGGGGRGLRRVEDPDALRGAVETAMREAEGAFGDPRVFLEQALTRPRHIEVQLLGDRTGEVLHLFERDCSVQRRHQKLVEMAPAPNVDRELIERICADAVAFGRAVQYENAGTVEFLVDQGRDRQGRYVFIEMNPRIQVEHTVTEETTDVDLVQTQFRLAGGETLEEMGLTQDRVGHRGVAIQCRITTEDPSNGFRPDVGRISAYRSPGGAGIRLDGAAYAGAEVSPYFDSLLVKLTGRGLTLDAAAKRLRRALAEFRVRGVRTNVAFLQGVLSDPDFLAGDISTVFVDEHPHLTSVPTTRDRATRLLNFLADVTVNRPHGELPRGVVDPRRKLPRLPAGDPPPGTRQRLEELGPEGFARWLSGEQALQVTDTTMRDAHQSLLATRMRTFDMLSAAGHIARTLPQLFSMEVWGGATYDVALRFLHEDPWRRLEALREALPNICLQMLLRGRNVLGYREYPEEVVRTFVGQAHATGIDIFRIFDANNDVEAMRPAIEAAAETGAVAEAALCYTGDLLDPEERIYDLDHYLRVADGVVEAGAHILCIKDMAGLLRAPAARALIGALKERFDLPVHLHTHDTTGGQLGTYVAAVEAGVDAVDGAAAPLSGMTSQPNLGAIVAATDHTPRASGLSLEAIGDLEPYWEAVRRLYAPFEAGLAAPTGTVYRHEIPGGQLSNLRQQAKALNLDDRFEEVEDYYARCNEILGDLIKVTPTSKVVGDLALYLLSAGVSPEEFADEPEGFDLPASVIGFFQGEVGTPPAGFPEPLRSRVLEGRESEPQRVELTEEQRQILHGEDEEARRALLNELLFATPARDQQAAAERWGDLSVVPTPAFLYGLEPAEELNIDLEPGVRLLVELEAVTEPDARGFRTALISLNGQTRPVEAQDRALEVRVSRAEKADPAEPGHIPAPLTGVVTPKVREGDRVEPGQAVATIEAMKMESTVTSPVGGTVDRVVATSGTSVEPDDLILAVRVGGPEAEEG